MERAPGEGSPAVEQLEENKFEKQRGEGVVDTREYAHEHFRFFYVGGLQFRSVVLYISMDCISNMSLKVCVQSMSDSFYSTKNTEKAKEREMEKRYSNLEILA